MTYKQHILKSIITVRSIEPVVRNLGRMLSNVLFQFLVENSLSFFCEKNFHIPHVFDKKLGLSSNSTFLT